MSTVDARALLTGPTATTHTAASWFNNAFTVDVNLSDGLAHRVSLYVCDWDFGGRSERIDVVDSATNVVLNSQTVSSFGEGKYLTWTVTGDVKFEFTSLAGSIAVVSGLFFGGSFHETSVVASFVGTDVLTQGNWSSRYGSNGYDVVGYDIPGGYMTTPSWATASPSGQGNTNWASSTTDVRAPLKAPNATDRTAAAWSGSTFTITLDLDDGQAHEVSLYMLDWDSQGRSERIDVVDPSNGTVLSSRTMSSFAGGKYLSWTVAGDVEFRVTSLAGPNAVVSGLFLGGTFHNDDTASFVGTNTTTQGN